MHCRQLKHWMQSTSRRTTSGSSAASESASEGSPFRGEPDGGRLCLGARLGLAFLGTALSLLAAASSACDAITTMSPSCSATALHRSVFCLRQAASFHCTGWLICMSTSSFQIMVQISIPKFPAKHGALSPPPETCTCSHQAAFHA